MSSHDEEIVQREMQEKLRDLPPADWVSRMIRDYRRDGRYRPADLRRLLGDPNRAVEIPTGADTTHAFLALRPD